MKARLQTYSIPVLYMAAQLFAVAPALAQPTTFTEMVATQRYIEGASNGEPFGKLAAQLWPGSCKNIDGTGPYAGMKLADCLYFLSGKRRIQYIGDEAEAVPENQSEIWMGRVVMLNADARTLQTWAEVACDRAKRQRGECVAELVTAVTKNSGGQFPVRGIVIEADKALNGKTEGDVSVFFKDGVTVRTAFSAKLAETPTKSGISFPGRQMTHKEILEAIDDLQIPSPDGLEVRKYARIIGIDGRCYQEHGHPPGNVWEGDGREGRYLPRWLDVTRDTYDAALKNPANGYIMFDLYASKTCR